MAAGIHDIPFYAKENKGLNEETYRMVLQIATIGYSEMDRISDLLQVFSEAAWTKNKPRQIIWKTALSIRSVIPKSHKAYMFYCNGLEIIAKNKSRANILKKLHGKMLGRSCSCTQLLTVKKNNTRDIHRKRVPEK